MDVSPSSGGSVKTDQTVSTSYPAVTEVESGRLVVLEAVPAPGYEFTGWSGNLAGNANPAKLLVDCNKHVAAGFRQKMHNLTLSVNGAGRVTPSGGSHAYVEGAVVSITATAESGYRFGGWGGEVSQPALAETTVIVSSDKAVVANFEKAVPGWLPVVASLAIVMATGGIIWRVTRKRRCDA